MRQRGRDSGECTWEERRGAEIKRKRWGRDYGEDLRDMEGKRQREKDKRGERDDQR